MTDEYFDKVFSNMFGGSGVGTVVKKNREGLVGTLIDFADTKLGASLGESIGHKMPEIIKSLGSERVGQVIDAYTGQQNPNQQIGEGQEQLTPEEQQKKTEGIIMGLDSTNQNHVLNFMQATGIKDYSDAQKAILMEQNRIIENRGLKRPEASAVANETVRTRQRSQPNDINRQLINQYDDTSPQYQHSTGRGSNAFFDEQRSPFPGTEADNINVVSRNTNTQSSQSPEEVILSLNPDDPASLHQYSAIRRISGVDATVIKKMLIKEQKELLGKMESGNLGSLGNSNVSSNSNLQEITEQKSDNSQYKWGDRDSPRKIINSDENTLKKITNTGEGDDGTVISREEFNKEIGLKAKNEDSKNSISQNKSSSNRDIKSEEVSIEKNDNNSNGLNNIMSILQRLDENSVGLINVVNENTNNVKIINDKILMLENEINLLKLNRLNNPNDIMLDKRISDVDFKLVSYNDEVKPKDEKTEDKTEGNISEHNESSNPENEVVKNDNNNDNIELSDNKEKESVDDNWWKERNNLLDNEESNILNQDNVNQEVPKGDTVKKNKFVIKKR